MVRQFSTEEREEYNGTYEGQNPEKDVCIKKRG